jgi:F0F1-type ATP synthase membrane subunit a
VFALPFADWISEHLLIIHGVSLEGNLTWIPIVCTVLLFVLFKFILGINTKLSVAFTAVMGAVMCAVEMSHGTHAVDGFLGFVGFSWHVVYIWMASAVAIMIGVTAGSDTGVVPGKFRSFVELILEFVRDQVVRPVMGKDGDQYVPYLLSFFFIILTCNLLGLLPSSTTATGNIWVTTALAVMSFLFYHGMGVKKFGVVQHLINLVPVHCDLKRMSTFVVFTASVLILNVVLATAEVKEGDVIVTAAANWLTGGQIVGVVLVGLAAIGRAKAGDIVLWLFMLVVELVGHFAKPFALAVRLFANMTGGHAVLYVMFGFGFVFKSWIIAAVVSVPSATAIMFLELMVAAIQAYVFTMLTTVFLQGSVNPEH